MGKANIKSHLGDGKYLADVVFDRRNIEKIIERLEKTIDELEYQMLIEIYRDDPNWKVTDLKIQAMKKRLNYYLYETKETEERELWCADLSEELSGEVGTIESHGGIGASAFEKVFIKPGYNEGSEYIEAEDGQLARGEEMYPWQWLYNWVALPSWQKFQPLYRLGTLVSVNNEANTGIVEMDAAVSAAQDLPITPEGREILNDVPFEYMQCGSLAFDAGDRVIVKFKEQTWDGEKAIVGFDENPKPCPVYLLVNINGHRVSHYYGGGKTVRIIQKDESNNWVQVGDALTVDYTNGIAGPFPDVDPAKPFRAQLYYRSPSFYLGRPLYWFQYFELGTEADHDLALGFKVKQDDTFWMNLDYKRYSVMWDMDKRSVSSTDDIESKSWYLKRVQWNVSDEGTIQQNASKVKVDLGGEEGEIKAFSVDFTCKVIRHRHMGFESDYPQVYKTCRPRSNTPRIYSQDGVAFADAEGWSYMASFAGDKTDGVWEIDTLGFIHGFPDIGYEPTNNLIDYWTEGGLMWGLGGSSFLNHFNAVNLQGCDIFPFIIALEDGSIVGEPPLVIFKVAHVVRFSIGYCIEWDEYDNCEGMQAVCGGDYVEINDTERHTYEYQPAELHEDLI